MASLPRIPTPIAQHIRRFRFQVLPVLVFVGVVAITSTLWDHQRNRQWATGEVDDVSVDLSFGTDGTLIPVSPAPQVMDSVRKGDIIARLDPKPIEAELAVLTSELAGLKAKLQATEAKLVAEQSEQQFDRQYEHMLAARRLTLDVERHQLDLLDRRAGLQTAKIELARLQMDYVLTEGAHEENAATDFDLENRRLRRDAAKGQVDGEQAALTEATRQLTQLKDRLTELRVVVPQEADIDTLLAPVRQAIATQQARIDLLEIQRESLAIISPIDGIITAVRYQAGQSAQAGEPIVKVTSLHPGDVISYLREGHEYRPHKGEEAFVQSRSGDRLILKGMVLNVGPEYERIPTHQLRDPQKPEYGLPVRISLSTVSTLLPGEMVDVTFIRTE